MLHDQKAAGVAYHQERNARDVVPELRANAARMREWFPMKPGGEGRLLREEIAANEIERLRARVAELEARIRTMGAP